MIKEYYDWLTYNPANIPITSLIRPIAFALIIIAIIMCAFYYAFSEKVSFKTIIVCFLLSPYVLLSILWEICFLNENLFVYLVPLYPVIAFLLVNSEISKITRVLHLNMFVITGYSFKL